MPSVLLVAQVAGLIATAWLVGSTHGRRIFEAAGIAAGLLAWSAAIGLAVRFTLQHLSQDVESLPVAVWFAPATLLLSQFSPAGLAAGLALVVSATRLLETPSPQVEPLPGHFVPALLASAGFQTAMVSLAMGYPLAAAALLAMSTALLTAAAIGLGAWARDRPPDLPRAVLGLVLTVLLAMMVGNGRGGGFGWGWGGGSGEDSATGRFETGGRKNSEAARSANDLPGNYPGVILWPEIKPVTALIAPLPSRGSGFAAQSQPLTIPFGGEYWMFRQPYRRPPPDSYFQRGTPSALSFSTPDRRPLQMEARHKLEQSISLSCCSRLEVAILNADPSSAQISLELILIDGTVPHTASQSLGVKPLASVPVRKTPVSETLDFPFPPAGQIAQFDEIRVVFHRVLGLMHKSARVSIERFVLMPLT